MNERKVSEDVALVANVMSRKLIKIDANGSALQAAKKMSENKVSSVILTSNHDNIEGIITERDLVTKMCAKDALPSKTPLISLLTKLSSIITIDKNSTVEEAAYLMLKNGVRHLPVTEENRKDIIGIITTTDFAKYLERRLESSDSQSSLLLQALCTEQEPTEERDIP